jgi:uncharacterized RDD family membrane protein YckC
MLQYATPVQRIFELIIDVIIFWVVFFIYLFAFNMDENGKFHFLQTLFSWPVLLYWIIYFPIIEGIYGQTFGKRAMKIRVASASGNELTLGQSVVRRLFDVVDLFFFGLVGILVMSRSDKNQRVGDKVAGTIVILHREVACVQCGVSAVLNPNELLAGKFTCPECGHLND